MTDLPGLDTFVHLARSGSISATARTLGVPRSTVTRRLARLEESVGEPLLERTTRSLRLTEAGQLLAKRGGALVRELRTLHEEVASIGGSPRGLLRVSLPPGLGGPFMPLFLREFRSRFPDIRFEQDVREHPPHLLDDHFDIVLTPGPLADSPWRQHKVSRLQHIAVASPDYLEQRGTPAQPDELPEHDCLAVRSHQHGTDSWPLRGGGQQTIRPLLISNDLNTIRQAALAGLGIALLPFHLCFEDFQNGSLVVVLPERVGRTETLYALVTPERRRSPLIRAVLDSMDAFSQAVPAPVKAGQETASTA
jgi:DNA-binding transcriptional LysR family regulator